MIKSFRLEYVSYFRTSSAEGVALSPSASAKVRHACSVSSKKLPEVWAETRLILGTQKPELMRITRNASKDLAPTRPDFLAPSSAKTWQEGITSTRAAARMVPTTLDAGVGAVLGALAGCAGYVLLAALTLLSPLAVVTWAILGAALGATLRGGQTFVAYHKAHQVFQSLLDIHTIFNTSAKQDTAEDGRSNNSAKITLSYYTEKLFAWPVRAAAHDAIEILESNQSWSPQNIAKQAPKATWFKHVSLSNQDVVGDLPDMSHARALAV